MEDFLQSLRSSDAGTMRALLARMSEGLGITEVPRGVAAMDHDAARLDRRRFAAEGFTELGIVADADLAERAVRTIQRLVAGGLPAVFAYAFDELWAIGDGVRERVEKLVGSEYRLVEDVWAWEIPPGRAGWPPHRGRPTRFDRDAPELINTWVALSDVEADRACMHFVPLDADRDYPDALHRAAADGRDRGRAVPLRSGEALAWNANVLHWGGPCSPRARGPRTSCSFSVVRKDALRSVGFSPVALEDLDFPKRLAILAQQVAVYGQGQPDVSTEIHTWAAATCALGAIEPRKDR